MNVFLNPVTGYVVRDELNNVIWLANRGLFNVYCKEHKINPAVFLDKRRWMGKIIISVIPPVISKEDFYKLRPYYEIEETFIKSRNEKDKVINYKSYNYVIKEDDIAEFCSEHKISRVNLRFKGASKNYRLLYHYNGEALFTLMSPNAEIYIVEKTLAAFCRKKDISYKSLTNNIIDKKSGWRILNIEPFDDVLERKFNPENKLTKAYVDYIHSYRIRKPRFNEKFNRFHELDKFADSRGI